VRIVARRLTFTYPRVRRPVLQRLDFEVPAHCSAAIVGPSGSGKTTLVSLMGGLLAPQSGDFACVDSQGTHYAPRDVATWILQTVSLLPDRSVEDNVRIGAYLDGTSRKEAAKRAAEALEEVGLAERAHDHARVLSGGEAQRVAIARALVSHRPVIFADEPTGNLDQENTDRVLDALLASGKRTVVLVTHDEQAAARCDLTFRMSHGTLVPAPVRASQ